MAGQRIIAGFDGICFNQDLKYLIDTLRVGGIILFSRNIKDRNQLRKLCAEAKDYARTCGQPPLFIAVDQEGGSVARLAPPDFIRLPDAAAITDRKEAEKFACITARQLQDVGINMNMAPVLDVADPQVKSIMARRSFGTDPDYVAEIGSAIIRQFQQNNIMAVGKHFPGIGRTTLDSHISRPDLDSQAHALFSKDLIPFKKAAAQQVAGIMLSHIRYTDLDPMWPASLSSKIACDILRKQMDYNGLIMTDDLEMGAVEKYYGIEEMIFSIIKADIDIALICRSMDKIKAAHKTFVRALKDKYRYRRWAGSISRILETKRRYLS
jgi:beta-N-acetylhexosaminidase